MSFEIYNDKSRLQFFNQSQLIAEREMLDTWDYEIVNSYGIDCWFVSQKAKFPHVKMLPNQQDIFFHAYGEIDRPEYNEPFLTRVYTQFTNDLFAINGFGLNADLTTTLIFNRTSFSLDAALALADDQTLRKTFNFKIDVNQTNPIAIIKFKGKNIYFKFGFNWKKNPTNISCELEEFRYDPENIVSPDMYASFKRRYSAKDYVKDYSISLRIKSKKLNPLTGKLSIIGSCDAMFVIKNPWKSFNEFQNRITPSVGDIVLIQGVDNKVVKLEITEVESENKTAQGINPMLGSYSYSCTAKPYIADNNANAIQNPVTAPTEINANKLIIQTILNHDASETAGKISEYEKWYTDDEGMDFTDDDVYGGYDLEASDGIKNPPEVPIHKEVVETNERIYGWSKYVDKDIQIKNGSRNIIYSPDNLYTYLKNMLDENFMSYMLNLNNIEIDVDYSMFDDSICSWTSCVALNIPLWYDKISGMVADKTVTAYTIGDRRLFQASQNSSLMVDFINANKSLINITNGPVLNGDTSKYQIPLMDKSLIPTYIDVINDKSDKIPIDILAKDVWVLSSYPIIVDRDGGIVEISVTKYVKDPNELNLRTDLYDIEQYNLGDIEYRLLRDNYYGVIKEWKKLKMINTIGPLVPIYVFDRESNTRLATNGEKLFYETTNNGQLYRYEIDSLNDEFDISQHKANKYKYITVPLSPRLNWIEGTDLGLFFNNAHNKRIQLFGNSDNIDQGDISRLTYQNDIASKPFSKILKFKSSPFKMYVELDKNGFLQLHAS